MTKVTHVPGDGGKRLAAALKQLRGLSGRVGWFESAKYENGTPVAYVATIQEYGYPAGGIVARMGLRAMIPQKQASWASFAERGAKMMLAGTATGADAMMLLGGRAEADFRKQIASVTEPVLKDSTLDARARAMGLKSRADLTGTGAKPLVEPARPHGGAGGLMIATVSNIVFQNGAKIAGIEKSGAG